MTASSATPTWPAPLGGSADSFTGLLLVLIEKADPGNRARLRQAFPRHVTAWEYWQDAAPGEWTSAGMEAALALVPDPDAPACQ